MMKIQHFLMQLKDQGLNVGRRFPLAVFMFFTAALFSSLTIQLDNSVFRDEALVAGLAGLFLAATQLGQEGFLSRKHFSKQILPIIILVCSAFYYFYIRQVDFILSQPAMIRTTVLYFIGLILFISIPTIQSNWTFSQTLITFIKAFFASLLLSVVMYLGIAVIFGTYSTLFTVLGFEWFGQAAAWIFIFFGPVYLLARIPLFTEDMNSEEFKKNDMPALLSSLIDFIVVPLLLVFTALLIAYILVNITSDFWLDNLIEPMLISYVVVGFLTLYLTEQSSRKWVQLFNHFFPYLLLVIALFQSLSSSIKSFEVGLTHGRYFVLLFGIFAITSVIIYGFFNQAKIVIPFILVTLGIISILPFIDAVSIGIASQQSQVESIIDEVNLDRDYTHDEKMQLSYSFNYLNETTESISFDWLPENFELFDDFQSTFGFEPYYYANYQYNQQRPEPVDREYAYVELNRDTPVVYPLGEAEEGVQFATYYMQDESGKNVIDLSEANAYLEVIVEEDTFMLELVQEDQSILTFDLIFLKDFAFDQPETHQSLSIDELTFADENEEVKLTVIVHHFETDREGRFNGEFFVLVDFN